MYAKLGNIEYDGLVSFSSMERNRSVNYAEHPLVNNIPRLQKVSSRNLNEIPLTFNFSYTFCDPEAEVATFIEMMNTGEILPLVDGVGKNYGDYVITDLKETVNKIDTKGRTMNCTVNLTLKEYVSPKTEQNNDGFAQSGNQPNRVQIQLRFQSSLADIQQTQIQASAKITKLQKLLAKAKAIAAKVTELVNKAKAAIAKVQALYAKLTKLLDQAFKAIEAVQNAVDSVLQAVKDIQQSIQKAKAALQSAMSHLQNAFGALASGDIDGAIQASRELRRAHRRMRGASAHMGYAIGARRGFTNR
jgi:phage protein U